MTENEVGVDLIHPDDIGVEIPEDDGPWRLANTTGDEAVMLLRSVIFLFKFGMLSVFSGNNCHAFFYNLTYIYFLIGCNVILYSKLCIHSNIIFLAFWFSIDVHRRFLPVMKSYILVN